MSQIENLTARLSALIVLVVQQHPDPELHKVPEQRTWVRVLASECFNLGVAMTKDDMAGVERRHRDHIRIAEEATAATAQANTRNAALNASVIERQERRDAKWEELCSAQNDSLAGIRTILADMYTTHLNDRQR